MVKVVILLCVGNKTNDNYWLLIGQKGTALETKNRRALVTFSCDVKAFGVHCHNDSKNTLWIAFEDLEKENKG